MEMFPIFLKLAGRRCLVVGAGTIAEPKIDSLLRAGANLEVVAPEALPSIQSDATANRFTWRPREFSTEDLDDVFLVVTATNVKAVNQAVAQAARERNILCNSVDDPPDCDFFYASVVRRGDLQIAISTAGKSPALAQRLREEIEALLPMDTGRWLDRLGQLRLRMLDALPLSQERKQALHLLARREVCEPQNCPVQKTIDTLLAAKIASPGSSHPSWP